MVDHSRSSNSRFTDQDYATGAGRVPGVDAAPGAGPEAAKKVLDQVAELREYAAYLAAVKLDSLKLTLRKLMIYAALGIVAAIASIVAICLAVTLALYGIADGLGVLFGGRYWLGSLVTGALVLGGTGAGVWIVARKITGGSREGT